MRAERCDASNRLTLQAFQKPPRCVRFSFGLSNFCARDRRLRLWRRRCRLKSSYRCVAYRLSRRLNCLRVKPKEELGLLFARDTIDLIVMHRENIQQTFCRLI